MYQYLVTSAYSLNDGIKVRGKYVVRISSASPPPQNRLVSPCSLPKRKVPLPVLDTLMLTIGPLQQILSVKTQ